MRSAASIAAILGAVACAAPETPEVLTYEEFKARAYHESETQYYVINGDELVTSEDELRAAYSAYRAEVERGPGPSTIQQGLAVNVVDGHDDRWSVNTASGLAFCVSQSSFGANYNAVVQAMDIAAAQWELTANVNFVHFAAQDSNCNNSNLQVVFNVRQVSGQAYLARSFFPNNGRSAREVLIDTSAYNAPPYTLAGILRHELGHVLGFRHEHTRPEAGSTCFEDNNWRALTAYDSASVMHYPQCGGTNSGDLVLTPLDVTGAYQLYPRRSGFDILWRDSAGGTTIWFMEGGSKVGEALPGSLGNDWTIQGLGDFNDFDETDILWRNTDGSVLIWFIDNGIKVAQTNLGAPGNDWQIKGIGDFDSDGQSDILWRNVDGTLAIWFIKNGANVAQAYPGVVADTAVIQAVADFDGDGKSDILWRDSNGRLTIWFMNGGSIVSQALVGQPPLEWVIQNVGDFDGNGRSDILWRHGDGTLAIWFMNGATNVAQAYPGQPPLEWVIRGIGDFDHDGKSDILWRHVDGTLAIWFMNGGSNVAQAYPGQPSNDLVIRGVGTFD